jgi:hypothetical protein
VISVKRVLFAMLLVVVTFQAHAVGHIADVSIYNRDTGEVLPVHFNKGQYWIAGVPGARYAVSISNRTDERILAVTSVDGVNAISGDTANWSQTGYVFRPWESYQIDGWRKSNSEVADFLFASSSASYATLTGRPANVGIIGVALFHERHPLPPAYSQRERPRTVAPAPVDVPAQAASSASPLAKRAAPSAEESLGTAHGQREESQVTQVDFERLQNSPNEIILIRYDSLPNLIAMGVVRPLPAPNSIPNAFPGAAVAHYVPDPPSYRP